MTKNPFINAFAAAAYIAVVASLMFYAPRFAPPTNSVMVPIAMLSLFTLSAAVMGYLFVFQPLQLYLDGEKKAAVRLFLKTLAAFACLTALILFVLFLRMFF